MASKLKALKERLYHYKVVNPDTRHHDIGRHTYCHLIYLEKGSTYPKFEVRSITFKDKVLSVGAVNWTVAAGTCTIDITEETAHLWAIEEDGGTPRILFGKA